MPSKQRAIMLISAVGLCLTPSSVTAAAAAAPAASPMIIERPAPVHKFLDAKNLTLLSVNAAMMVADFASTKRALQVPGAREANPLMQSPGAAISLKIVGVGAGLGFAYLMHRAGHHQAERLMPLFVGVPSTAAAWHNAGIHR